MYRFFNFDINCLNCNIQKDRSTRFLLRYQCCINYKNDEMNSGNVQFF